MPFSQISFWIVPIIALVSYCLLMFIFAVAQKDKYIKSFMVLIGALILWTAAALMMRLDIPPSVLFWNKAMVTGTILTPFLLYVFVAIFTNTFNLFRTFFWTITTTIILIVNFKGLVVVDASVIRTMVNYNGSDIPFVEFVYTMGPAAPFVFTLMFLMICAILLKTRQAVRNGTISQEGIAPIAVGALIMFMGSLLNMVPAIGKYPVDILACFVNFILIVIAIFKYRILELKFIVAKGMVYMVFASLITVVYVYLVLLIHRQTDPFYQNIMPYFVAISALIVALLFQPLFNFGNQIVDKMFYRTEYSHRQALKNFSSVISNNLDLNVIAGELINAVQLAIRPNQVLLLSRNEEKDIYFVFKTSSQLFRVDLAIADNNPLVTWFKGNNRSLSLEQINTLPFFKSMWDKEKRELHDLGVEVIIPIKSRSELIGILMLTRKSNNTAYTLYDLDLLSYLGASTAVAFENAHLYARSQIEALTDSLTKLYNHRYFHKALAEQMDKVGSSELSILMIDLDLFKLYNDLYGHVEGDKALEMVAAILKRNVDQKGIVCRYGGEEFTVLLPYYDAKMAYEMGEKIRIDIETSFFSPNDVTQRFLTASIGVCTYPHAAPNSEELLKRADLAMYTAKNSGKNKTVIYNPEITHSEVAATGENSQKATSKPNFTATIYALTAAIDAKDHYTFGHSQKVAEYATALACKLSLDKSHIEIIKEAALLHDVGKIGIPEHILTKTGRLTSEEFEMVKQHVEMSITIIKHLPSMNHIIPAVIGHHERWDGKGYPRGLKGENIPMTARCLTVADAFDAMTSARPYRPTLTVNSALEEIENNAGTQFDPLIATIFVNLVREGVIKVEQKKEPIKNVI